MIYTTRKITSKDIENIDIHAFIIEAADESDKKYGSKFNWVDFPIREFADKHCVWICFKGDEPVGLLAAVHSFSDLDPKVVILKQLLLYSRPNTKATWHLLRTFIDFGKKNAKHIITVIGTETNIKPRSLQKLGFSYLETLYRMET